MIPSITPATSSLVECLPSTTVQAVHPSGVIHLPSLVGSALGKRNPSCLSAWENSAIHSMSSGEWLFSREVSFTRFKTMLPTLKVGCEPPESRSGEAWMLNASAISSTFILVFYQIPGRDEESGKENSS